MNIGIFYFSATGVTETISNHIAKVLEGENNSVNLTNIIIPEIRRTNVDFSEFDALIFGFPVFAGRVPSVAEEWLITLDGKNRKCAQFFTYGARDLEWAHQTTYYLLTQANFDVVLSAEFIGRHSFNVALGWYLAEGRPNQSDLDVARDFAFHAISRFQGESEFSIDLSNFSYKPIEIHERSGFRANFYPRRDQEECSMCLLCEKECPVKAFDAKLGVTDQKLCINCMHCVVVCPDKAIHVREVSKLFKKFMKRFKLNDEIVFKKRSRIIF